MDYTARTEKKLKIVSSCLQVSHKIRSLSIAIMSYTVYAKRNIKRYFKNFLFPTEKLKPVHLTIAKIMHVFSYLLTEASNDQHNSFLMSHCILCEVANMKIFSELKLQFAFSGASVLQLISTVRTEKNPHQTPRHSGKLFTSLKHLQSAKSIWHAFAVCLHKEDSKQALTEIPRLNIRVHLLQALCKRCSD